MVEESSSHGSQEAEEQAGAREGHASSHQAPPKSTFRYELMNG